MSFSRRGLNYLVVATQFLSSAAVSLYYPINKEIKDILYNLPAYPTTWLVLGNLHKPSIDALI